MRQLSTSTKLFYGLGFAAQGIKDGLFQLFLFFYYSQLLGLDAAIAGVSTLIALLFDAVSDPIVGMISDRWKSKKWGRRHPFMFASAIPFGLFLYLLFLPPAGMGTLGLFLWLTCFTILVRIALTLFLVPAMSLGAELTTDYEERTEVTSYRIMFGAFLAPFIIIFGLLTFFVPEEGMTNGLSNSAAYPKYALLCGILAIIFIFISTWGTRNTITTLPKASVTQQATSLSSTFAHLGTAIKMPSYRTLVAFTMIVYIGIGVGTIFSTYFATYFFGLSEKELAGTVLASAAGGFLSLFVAPWVGRKFDKKWGAFYATILFAFFFSLPFNLRLLGWFPDNGDGNLLLYYCLSITFGYLFLWVALGLTNSMMAEVIDEYELISNTREEGLFFSTMSFAYKLTVGAGYLIAGLLLNWIQFPKQTELVDIPTSAIEGLGLVGGPVLLLVYLSSIGFLVFYPINRDRYNEIRATLNKDSSN